MNVQFSYALNQRVLTPDDSEGIITMAAVDDIGRQYFVKTLEEESLWFSESQLRPL